MNTLLFFILATFWGGSFIAIQNVVSSLPPYLGAFFRVFFALIMLSSLFKLMGKQLQVQKPQRRLSWLGGLFSIGLPFSFLFWGEQYIAPALAAILNGTVPILTFVLAYVFNRDDETFTLEKGLAVVFGIIGLVIIFEPKLASSGHQHELWGAASVMMMALSYAIGVLINRRLLSREGVSFHANLVQQHFSASVFLMALFFIFESMPTLSQVLQWRVIDSVFYLAFFSNTLAFIIFFHLIKQWGSVRASMVTYVAPVMTILFDWQINHHLPARYELVGAGLILLGVVISQKGLTLFRSQAAANQV